MLPEDTIICPFCGENLTSKRKKKNYPLLIIILCSLVALIFYVVVIQNATPSETQDQPTTIPHLSDEKFESPPAVYGMNETVSKGNVSITWENTYTYSGKDCPIDKTYVLLEFTVENNSNDHIYVNALDFYTYFDDCSVEQSIDAELFADDLQQISGYLAPGKKRTGIIGYEVPRYWQRVEVYYSSDFFKSSDLVFGYTFHIYAK